MINAKEARTKTENSPAGLRVSSTLDRIHILICRDSAIGMSKLWYYWNDSGIKCTLDERNEVISKLKSLGFKIEDSGFNGILISW